MLLQSKRAWAPSELGWLPQSKHAWAFPELVWRFEFLATFCNYNSVKGSSVDSHTPTLSHLPILIDQVCRAGPRVVLRGGYPPLPPRFPGPRLPNRSQCFPGGVGRGIPRVSGVRVSWHGMPFFRLTSFSAFLDCFICLQELQVCPCRAKVRRASGPGRVRPSLQSLFYIPYRSCL